MEKLLTDRMILQIHDAILSLDLDRDTLLAGTGMTKRLRQVSKPDEQVLSDLHALNQWRNVDGSIPLQQMLEKAYHLTKRQVGASVFETALVTIANAVVRPSRPVPNATESVTKLAFLLASPRDQQPIDVSQEIRDISDWIRRSRFRDAFLHEIFLAVRVRDLQDILLRAKPTIVHFSGHGNEQHELLLETDDGQSAPVEAAAFAQLFQVVGRGVRCVVLNACSTAMAAKEVSAYVDVAIGSEGPIQDVAARAFAEGFYNALGHGQGIQAAFEAGNNRIDLGGYGKSPLRLYPRQGVKPDEIIFSP
jgi:CHAT domain